MTDSTDFDDDAARALAHLVRDLPLRHAPGTLESRVVLQLQRRQADRWWRRGFAHWPAAARATFIATSIALIGIMMSETRWSTLAARVLQRAFSWALSWAYPAVGAIASATDFSSRIAHALPVNWVYAFVTITALLYAALFGLGIAAYRTLYLSPSPGQVIR